METYKMHQQNLRPARLTTQKINSTSQAVIPNKISTRCILWHHLTHHRHIFNKIFSEIHTKHEAFMAIAKQR